MKNTIKTLQQKLTKAQRAADEYRDAIAALQKVCEHDYTYEGHSHNDDLYVCRNCGKEDWR
jgi:excinuclease UvrABC nuclease subunit